MYTLYHGEKQALSVCLRQSILRLISDDTAARLVAKTLHIQRYGTLGLLLRAVRKGYRTPEETLALLSQVPTQFNSSEHLKEKLTEYLFLYNNHIVQKNIGHVSPVTKLKEWQKSNPELFKTTLINQSRPDKGFIMADWSGGYVTEVSYPYSYRGDMNLVRIRALLTLAGYVVPEHAVICELGFGQGVAINIHACAMAHSVSVGTDFSPAQTGFAQALSKQTGAEMLLVDQSFAQFCVRDDLPQFDFIVAHGIWSWVSEENRQLIESFVARQLTVGGAFVFSYNAMPGWATFVPVRDFMLGYADKMTAPAMNISQKLNQAMRAVHKLRAIPAKLSLLGHEMVEARLGQMERQDPNHLVHEYFNRDWQPMAFPDVCERMQAIKLDYACSAAIGKHLDNMNFTPEQLQAIADIADPILAEYTRDLFANTDFRIDIYLKGKRKLPELQHANALAAMRFVLVKPMNHLRVAFVTPRGEAEPDPASYHQLLALLSDYQVHSVQELYQHGAPTGARFIDTLETVKLLWAAAVIAPAQSASDSLLVQARVSAFNAYIIGQSLYDTKLAWLASHVTGGAIALSRSDLLCLLALQMGMNQPSEMANFIAQIDVNVILTQEEIEQFMHHRLPMLSLLCALE